MTQVIIRGVTWVESRFTEAFKTLARAPKANVICWRFIGSVRRECLDHMLIINARYLYRLIDEYAAYHNHARPHQGIQQRIPVPKSADRQATGLVWCRDVLGGIIHDYYREAA